jgi:FMN-dependent NADH-azoreductase
LPEAKIVQRDLAKDRIPHMDYSTLKAISSKDPAEVQAHKESARLSDQLTDELLASDLLVMATPMWNTMTRAKWSARINWLSGGKHKNGYFPAIG